MRDFSRSAFRKVVLLALALSATACVGCRDDNTAIVDPEIAGKKGKQFEDARAEVAAQKGKPKAARPKAATSPAGR